MPPEPVCGTATTGAAGGFADILQAAVSGNTTNNSRKSVFILTPWSVFP
jgi:hypothetical protein